MRRAAAFALALMCAFITPCRCALARAVPAHAGRYIAGADAQTEADIAINNKLQRLYAIYDVMGACVAVIENGEVTRVYCHGAATASEAVTPDTCFRVGSIGKLAAGIGLMRLVEDGKAGLEDELGALLGLIVRNPAYPYMPVTLRQLMTHTAGLRDSGDYKNALTGDILPLGDMFGKERAQYAFEERIAPGSKRLYSNLGGGLAGSIIEKLTGQPLDDYMNECLFEPLGITAGYNASRIPDDICIANMYHMPQEQLAYSPRRDDPPEGVADYTRDYVLTAGKLTISAPDLAKIIIMLCDGGVYQNTRILKESTVLEMTTPQNRRGSVSCDSNNGLFMNIITNDQVEGRTMYGHGGNAHGMLCAAYYDPVDRTGVVMLTNGCRNRSMHNDVGMLGRRVMGIIYGELLDNEHEASDPYLVE